MNTDLSRFISAQNRDFPTALQEIKSGRKCSHWMWYIFPQISGLGFSETSKYYSIKNISEAKDFLNHPVLGKNIVEISEALLALEEKSAGEIFGFPDDMKLKSSMTLFSEASEISGNVFDKVLDKYFGGEKDEKTLRILGL